MVDAQRLVRFYKLDAQGIFKNPSFSIAFRWHNFSWYDRYLFRNVSGSVCVAYGPLVVLTEFHFICHFRRIVKKDGGTSQTW